MRSTFQSCGKRFFQSLLLLRLSQAPIALTILFRNQLPKKTVGQIGDQGVATDARIGFMISTLTMQEEVILRSGQDAVLADLQQRGCGRGIKIVI